VEQNQHSGLDFLILIFLIFLVIIKSFFILKRNRTPRDKVRIKNFQEPIVNDEKSEVFEKLHSKILQWSAEKKFLNSNVSLSSLAAELNTNTAYLSCVFNKIIGVSFSEYISKHRVEYLVSKVKENPKLISNKSSIQIAEMGGFMSIDAYNSAFKKYLGKTPRQYFMEIV
jgi:YesN/AraC family two-component response regulator